ncbi:hypothetical protein TWF694_007422 [Orbilia ellipsospora]|uniref:Uncharacterized protein n=1 Tax=Orbilia ellipsospora TaxID=2528407 RepID=A0AAV9XPD7_9PEZI
MGTKGTSYIKMAVGTSGEVQQGMDMGYKKCLRQKNPARLRRRRRYSGEDERGPRRASEKNRASGGLCVLKECRTSDNVGDFGSDSI